MHVHILKLIFFSYYNTQSSWNNDVNQISHFSFIVCVYSGEAAQSNEKFSTPEMKNK